MFIDAEKEGYNVKYPRVLSEEHKQMISLALKGKPISEEHKQMISLAKKGQTFSKEHTDNLSKAWEGRRLNGVAWKGRRLNRVAYDSKCAKLTEEQAQYVIDNKGIIIQKELAKELGVSRSTIEKIHANTIWKHLPRTKENTK
tara:strand:- start:29 stop:457 length:429 start_codon:yes stop_codon:yes gene_type:complete